MADTKNSKASGATGGLEAIAESPPPVSVPETREKTEGPETFKLERVDLATEVTEDKSRMVEKQRIRELAETKDYDPATVEALKKLDIQNSAEEQPHAWRTFQTIASVSLVRFFIENPQASLSLDEFPSQIQGKKRFVRPDEAALIGILRQIQAHPDSPLGKDIIEKWPELVSLAREVTPYVSKIEQADKKGWDSPGIFEKTKDRVITFLQAHPNIRKTAVVLGVLGAGYIVGKWLGRLLLGGKKTADDNTQSGLLGKIWTGARVAALATLGCFAYGYVKRNHPDWKEWFTSWFEKQNKPTYESLAKRMNIDQKVLERLGGESYVSFIKGNLEGEKGWGWIPTLASEKLGIEMAPTGFGKRKILGFPLPFTGLSLNEVNQVRNFLKTAVENPKVKAELQKYRIDLANGATTLASIFAVLNKMDKEGSLESTILVAENKDNDPERDEAYEQEDGTVIGVASKTFDELEDLAKEDAPHIRAVVEKWRKKGLMSTVWNMGDFSKEFVQAAAKEDGFALVISGSKVILWNGVSYVVVTSVEAVTETFRKAAEAVFLDTVDAPDIVPTYFKKTYEFMVIGGLVGLFRGGVKSGKFGLVPGRALGALRGAVKGALFPIHVLYKTTRAGARVYHEAKTIPWRFKRIFSGAEAHAQYWAEQAKIEAAAYRRWYALREYRIGGLRHPVKSAIAKHLIPEDIETYTHRYGSKFSNAYNRFAEGYNKAFATEIAAGTRRSLEIVKFDPNIDARMEKIMQLIKREFPETPRGVVRAPSTFEEALEAEKLRLDPKKTKLARYWSRMSAILGPAAAATTIYHLETTEDKKKAVTETALGYAGFITGVTITERTFGQALKHPLWHGFAVTLGGMAGALGLTGGLEDIVNDYLIRFPGAYKVSGEVAHILELASAGYLGKKTISLAKKEMVTKAVEKIGLKGGVRALEEALMKKLTASTLFKQLESLAAKGILKKIAARLGLKLGTRGAVLVAGHAIPGINLLALAVDAALLPFFAKDIYDIVNAARSASRLNDLMKERRNHPFVAVEILEPPEAKTKFEQYRTQLAEQGETATMGFFDQFSYVKIKIRRQDVKGDEIWMMKKGSVEGLAILDAQGKEMVAMESKDMKALGEKTFPEEAKETPKLKPIAA